MGNANSAINRANDFMVPLRFLGIGLKLTNAARTKRAFPSLKGGIKKRKSVEEMATRAAPRRGRLPGLGHARKTVAAADRSHKK
jgi:hypothetical protein